MRQSLHGVFDPDVKVPEGRIRDAVLLTHAARHARLEDMSFAEPSYGLRDHTYEADCKLEKREAGAKVGALATDCVASEHSPELRLKKWLNNSVQHAIGMRQTAKTQVTDVRFAKLAKDSAKPMMAIRRR